MPADAHGWRPIAEAPRDGTQVLLSIVPGGHIDLGQWVCELRAIDDEPSSPAGWLGLQVFSPDLMNPTHWQPLLGPPDA